MSVGQSGELFEEWLELRNGCLCCSVKYVNVDYILYYYHFSNQLNYVRSFRVTNLTLA